jgi:hypothetical protein
VPSAAEGWRTALIGHVSLGDDDLDAAGLFYDALRDPA